MRKRIFLSICFVTLFVLVVSLFLVTESTYRYISETQTRRIKNQLVLVAGGVATAGEKYLSSTNPEGIRVTWISKDGTVLYDNEKSAAEMENHMERPEIIQASETGYGESTRYSSTILKKQFYCAEKMADGSIIRISDSQGTVFTLLAALLRTVCLTILFIIVIAFLAARNLSKKIVEPVNRIDLDDPSEAKVYDELRPLISRLSIQQEQLRIDRAELEKTEQIRQEFTSNVSHELKTPLHAISGYAELLSTGLVAEQDIVPFAIKIHDESSRLAQLVEDVIALSRLDSRLPELESEPTDLYRITVNVIDSLESFAKEKNVSFTLDGTHSEITGIPQLLHSIVFNLCDNAIKYNKEGGYVKVVITESEHSTVLSVSDSGIGIPDEHIDRIFERFYRIDKSHSREVGGTGLGLSIVKHAAALHNAAITVDSTPGKGTTVSVAFPKS